MIAQLLRPEYILVATWIAAGAFVHYRGRVRHPLSRQISDHSTVLAPVNCFMYLFSGVPNRPFVERDRLPELNRIRDNWTVIRDEARALYEAGHIRGTEHYEDAAFNSFIKKGWKRFHLEWYGESLPSARKLCPHTVALLEETPAIRAAMFALLPAGGKLVRHRDPYAGSLRYHLGLITPNDVRCRIYVDGESYAWRDGEDVVFDETYIHYAHNETDVDRIILFCDVERPMRFRFAAAFNRWFARNVMPISASRNEQGEEVGALNRVFPRAYAVRLRIKAFKKSHRKLYYVIKFAVFGGLLGLLLFGRYL